MIEELKRTIDAQGTAFEEFKKANDEKLAEMAKKGTVDPVLVEKVEKANTAIAELGEMKRRLEQMETRANRPAIAGESKLSADQIAHKEAFRRFVRKGADDGLAELEQKAVSVGVQADGGYALPIDQDREIAANLVNVSPIRALANVITVGTSDYRKLVNTKGTASGWVGETDARTATNTSTLHQVTPFMGELYANPQATQNSLDDLFFNVEQFINDELTEEFGRAEGAAFVSGDGTKKPKGFLAYTMAATKDGARAFGSIQYVPSGDASAFIATSATANPADCLITLVQSLKQGHRNGASFAMNKATVGTVRTFKDAYGNYIWRPGLEQGRPDTILGYGVTEAEDMPDVAANALPIAFANWKKAYTIVDRIGIRTLRDPFTNKPYVGFYTTKRVGGMLVLDEAIKVLKNAAA